MAIDDPVDAVLSLNSSDERRRSPASDLGKHFIQVIKLLSPKGLAIPISTLEGIADWVGRQRSENREELLEVVVQEIKRHGPQIEQLRRDSEKHRRFMEDEMPGLVLEALRRAERTRAKERIRRLGRILIHAAQVGTPGTGDQAEEMMRIATELTERDGLLLREIHKAQCQLPSLGVVPWEEINNVWREHPPRPEGMGENEIQSICAKLQSFGLVVRVERNNSKLAPTEIPYALLQKGKEFISFAMEAED